MAMLMSFIGLSSAATRFELSAPVAGLDVYVQAGEAVWAVVAVVAAGLLRCAESAADLAGEGVIAGMGLVVAFFKGLPLVFAVHGVSS